VGSHNPVNSRFGNQNPVPAAIVLSPFGSVTARSVSVVL
jgi:hypothetical protein